MARESRIESMSEPVTQAMILAAGRGERMRPLTDNCPKPLLEIAGKSLIEYHLEALKQAGIKRIIINHAWLGEQIEHYLGDGTRYDLELIYSAEGTALNTGGGIKKALPHFNGQPFILVNGDVWTDYNYQPLIKRSLATDSANGTHKVLAHLVLVANPEQHPEGDFCLMGSKVSATDEPKKTYSGIGLYSPELFADISESHFPLAPILQQAMSKGLVSGELYAGHWYDIGTPERLAKLEQLLA